VSARRWLVPGLVVVLLLGGGALTFVRHLRANACGAGDDVVTGSKADSPLLTAAQLQRRPDQRLDRLARAIGSMPAPFGKVVGGLAFDYGQYLNLAGLPDGLAATTKNNALFAVLSPTLEPRWGIENSTDPHAWDVSSNRFFNIDQRPKKPITVSSYDLADGHRFWCTPVGTAPVGRDDPLSTQVLSGGDLLVLAGPRDGLELSRLGAGGKVQWHRQVRGVDEGDFVGGPSGGTFVAGGRPAYELADPAALARTKERTSLTGYQETSGHAVWTHQSPAGSALHVVGDLDGQLVVTERTVGVAGPTGRLFALDTGTGKQLWTVEEPAGGQVDVALRGGVVLVRTSTALFGYAGATGSLRWHTRLPKGKQVFPYGFALDQQPMLDEHRVLLAGTEALFALDVRTGKQQRFRLPVDGISTTYWPYQLAVTDQVIGVVTNIGGVVVARQ
jgi:outer membrane protein assembly factor BamB